MPGANTLRRLEKQLEQANARIRELEAAIESHQRTEEALSKSEQRLASSYPGMGAYSRNLRTGQDYWSPEFLAIYGLGPDEPLPLEDGIPTAVHPADRPRVLAESRLDGRTGPEFSSEHRILLPDGKVRWVLVRGRVERDTEHEPRAVYGFAQDTTERKVAEEAAESQRALLAAITDNIPVLLCIWHPELQSFVFNKHLTEVLGWTAADAADGDFMAKAYPDAEYRREVIEYMLSLDPGWRDLKTTAKDGRALDISWANRRLADGTSIGIGIDIRQRKADEAALRDSEDRLKSALSIAMLGTWEYDVGADIIYFDDRSLELFGLMEKRSLAKSELFELIHPGDRSRLASRLRAALDPSGDGLYESEHRVNRPDGSVGWLIVHGRVSWEGEGKRRHAVRASGTFRDITKRKQSEEALRASEETARRQLAEIQAIYETAPIGLCVFDTQLRWVRLNKRIAEINGFPIEAHLGKTPREIVPDVGEQAEHALQQILDGKEAVLDFEMSGTTAAQPGVLRYWNERWIPIKDDKGRIIGISVAAEEITERKRMEEELRRANEILETRVRERTAELRKLVSALTQEVKQRHEAEQQLRLQASQLRALAGELTLAEQRERRRLGKILHDHLQQLLVGAKFRVAILGRTGDELIRQAASEIDGLLAESIGVSRSLTAELSPPILMEGGLKAGLEWLVRWMRDKYALEVDLVIQDEFPRLSNDVTALLFESLRELLFNTVKHARVSSVTVTISELKNGTLRIQVRDEGRGFDPTTLKPSSEIGAGFGLFSIRERLCLIGGKIDIHAASGEGTRIVLTVPLDQGPGEGEPAALVPPRVDHKTVRGSAAVPISGSPIRVLLADDHAVVRDGLARVLSQEPDMQVAGQARDGQEAVELAGQLLPEVILMDVGMPRLNGVEATRIIHNEFPEIRIIGLSMFEEKDRAQAMRDAGAADYRSKSAATADLLAAIRSVANRTAPGLAAQAADS